MRAQGRWVVVGCLVLAAAACDGTSAKPCPAETETGATLQCNCMPGVLGTQTCEKNKLLSDCSCDDADDSTTGATMSGDGTGSNANGTNANGGSSSLGSAASAAPGVGGATSAGGDAGPGGSTDGSTADLPSDGNQLSVCTMAASQCNKDYACYAPDPPGNGFCSHVCTMDSDCEGLQPSGTNYTCATDSLFGATAVCEIACTDDMDTTTCPTGMTCQASAFGGGFPGGGFADAGPSGGGFPGGGWAGGGPPGGGWAGGGPPGAGFPGGGFADGGVSGSDAGSGSDTPGYTCRYP